jgi:hypothetical protein
MPPASSAPRRSSPRPGHEAQLWDLAYLILVPAVVAAATLILRHRRPTGSRSRAPYASHREGRLVALASRLKFRGRLTHLHRVSRRAQPLRPPDPGPVTASPEDPLRTSTTLRVLARLHDAGVLDDDQFAAKQAEIRQADSLRALAELHDMGLLDDDQFAVKTAQIRDGSTRAV